MKRNPSDVHPEDTLLLAYLDGELLKPATRSMAQHLQACWKCRAAITELELQAQAASKLFIHQAESDVSRADAAKAKFLERKSRFETESRRSLIQFLKVSQSMYRSFGGLEWLNHVACQPACRSSPYSQAAG